MSKERGVICDRKHTRRSKGRNVYTECPYSSRGDRCQTCALASGLKTKHLGGASDLTLDSDGPDTVSFSERAMKLFDEVISDEGDVW